MYVDCDVSRMTVTRASNTPKDRPSHLVTGTADVGASFEGPFTKREVETLTGNWGRLRTHLKFLAAESYAAASPAAPHTVGR